MRLRDRASDGRRAYTIVGTLFARIIRTLRRDPRFSAVPRFDLELLLADERAEAERQLVRELRDRIHADDLGEDFDDV
ncbi:hypothetical protein [Bradyrhizobium sp. CCBAU 53380]|uniref:hypothetical protein n=1 Tax=Bradyrhizobium sp. CCBAU 53380 TaxID=1325117 RepID=UPI00230209E2|nr:hypothetical protein [Bradyrhizobium sp. CCBAU 53380]MDA9424024.1 hypothetical protein [Bradyrhizobium sp. CCBAU 53380]